MAETRNDPIADVKAPRTLFFRCEETNADTEYLPHSHDWGQLICVKTGIIALNIAGQRFLAPPGFAVWLPAGMEHSSHNRKPALFRTINIAKSLCAGLPEQAGLITLSSVFNAIFEDCLRRKMLDPQSREDLRLSLVLIDQLRISPIQQTYLPTSKDKFLAPVLQALERSPADNTPLAAWAKRVYTTERTLSRRCQQELGMSFSEWRQRLRFLHALSLLEQGKTVQAVALEVGYSSASSFIAMFQQIGGTTPDHFRRM